MIDISTFPDVANIDLGKFSPKPTSLEGNQVEASRSLYRSPDGVIEIGVWECTPGHHVSADRSFSSETSHIIAGRVEIRRANGEIQHVGPGDVLVLPQGWRGEWRVLETVRKLYIIHKP